MVFSDMLYMLVRYASPSCPMCLGFLMLTLSGPAELRFYCLLDLCSGGWYCCCLCVFLCKWLFVLYV